MVAPIWLVPGWMKRAALAKEGKLLKDQLNTVSSTAQAAQQALQNKKGILLPGMAVAGGGLIAGKSLVGTKKPMEELPPIPNSFMSTTQTADFILGLAASLENAAASTMIGLRNAKLKKRVADAQAMADSARIALEGKRAKDMMTLGALGLGATGVGAVGTKLMNKSNPTTNLNNIDEMNPDMYNISTLKKLPSNFSANTKQILENVTISETSGAAVGAALTKKHFMGK